VRITLVMAAARNDPLRKNDPFMPLAPALLAGAAPGHDYRLVDLFREDDVDLGAPADLVGISMRYTAENRAYGLADAWRRRGVRVVLGGPQASCVPHRAKEHADAVVVGEGEKLWPVILEDAQRGALRDFYVCSPVPFDARGGSLLQIDAYDDLLRVPRPLRRLYRHRYPFDTVFAARGCHVDCDFCCVPGLFGKRYRTRPVEEVVAEIDTLGTYYYLLDDTVFGRPSTYGYYARLYEALAGLERRRWWTGQANLDAAATPEGREVVRKAVAAGLVYAAVGMESVNPDTLARNGALAKTGAATPAEAIGRMKESIRFIQDLGVIVSGWFVVGYEGDTIETYGRTLDFCREMKILPAIFPVKVLPGTRLHARLGAEGKLDEGRRINFVNPSIRDEEVYREMGRVAREGYSWREIARRLVAQVPRFRSDRARHVLFSLILQAKIGGALDVSRDEFYGSAGSGG